MNKYEIMRRFVIGLFIWNLILTCSICIDKFNQGQAERDEIICQLEGIPPYEIIEEVE